MLPSTRLFLLALQIMLVMSQDSFETKVQSLLDLLTPVPAQGSPFPSIKGPRHKDRVCIIGAGPAGIHMALSLKRRNYSSVEVFEKSNRVGGKSFDIEYDGTNQPQGATFITPDYFENLVPLAREFGVGDIVPATAPMLWTTNNQDGGVSLREYLLAFVSKLTNSSSIEDNFAFVLKTLIQYVEIHKQLFGSYEGDMMLRPSHSTLDRVQGTFLEFLTRESLTPLVPIFKITHTRQGYGHLDEISALYGLMWNTPKLMITSALLALGQESKEPLGVFFFKHGFELIWKTIVKKEGIKVHYNVDIGRIKRYKQNIELGIWEGSLKRQELCDWVIWTPSMIEFLKTSADTTHQEFSLLASLSPSVVSSSFVQMKAVAAPYQAFMKNINEKVEHGVTGSSSIVGLLDPANRTPRGMEKYIKDGNKTTRSYYVGQTGKNFSNELELNTILRNHFEQGFQGKDLEILNTISWSYFPRWNPAEMSSGRPWDVFDTLQGKNRMWFAGSSVSFESISGVLEYNNLLLRQMESLTETAQSTSYDGYSRYSGYPGYHGYHGYHG